MDRKLVGEVWGAGADTVHKDYLSKETGKRKEGLRDLDQAGVQNKDADSWERSV